MLSREDLESYLIRLDAEYEEIDDGMYLVRSREEGIPMVVNHSPPLLVLRLKIMDIPAADGSQAMLYRTLLELNATDVVHGAYGIEGSELVLSQTLQLESLDFPVFQASVDSILMAASSHMERIRSLATSAVEG